MQLAELIDLEWLLRPEAEPAPWQRERDHEVGRQVCKSRGIAPSAARARLHEDRALREALCTGWLEAVHRRRNDLPGARIAHALSVCGWILFLPGLLIGAGAARSLLAYDGSVPVNVLYFALVFFGLQILLLLAMVWFVLRSRRPSSGGGPGLLHQPIAFLAGRFLGERGREALADLRSMQSRRGLLGDVERWTLFALTQRLGVAFNLAALAVAFALIAFSDLTFSWSSTLNPRPETVHAGVRAVSWPWWWWSDAVPSLEVIRASQWDRMQGRFVNESMADAIPLAANWWRFLLAGLCAWGLLPRLLALGFGGWRAARARAATGLDHAGFQALYERLLPHAAEWEGPDPEAVRGSAPPAQGRMAAPPKAVAGAPAWLVVWGSLLRRREQVARQLGERLRFEVRGTFAAGAADLAADGQALQALQKASASRVVVAFAAGLQPTAEVVGFLRSLRSALGPGRPLMVVLLAETGDAIADAEAEERSVWQRSLAAVMDPHLWLATLEKT